MEKPKTTDASGPRPHPNNIHLIPKTVGTAIIMGEAINRPYFGIFLETPSRNLNDIMKQVINHLYESIDIEWG